MSWAIESIEKAAMERAKEQILGGGIPILVIGLNIDQIISLREYYENKTGKRAEDILQDRKNGRNSRIYD